METLRKHWRKYGPTFIEVWRKENGRPEGPIKQVILRQADDDPQGVGTEMVLDRDEVYGLIDTVSVVDPDEFRRRFPDTRDETLEKVANIARMREEVCAKLAMRLTGPQRRAADLYSAKADAFREIEAIILNHKKED